MYPENTAQYQDTLFMIIMILFGAMIFCGVCYKYFVASFIVFMVLIMTCMSTANYWLADHHISEYVSSAFVKLAILGYAAIIVGGVIEYLLSSLLYRKQLSELAMSGLSKSMK